MNSIYDIAYKLTKYVMKSNLNSKDIYHNKIDIYTNQLKTHNINTQKILDILHNGGSLNEVNTELDLQLGHGKIDLNDYEKVIDKLTSTLSKLSGRPSNEEFIKFIDELLEKMNFTDEDKKNLNIGYRMVYEITMHDKNFNSFNNLNRYKKNIDTFISDNEQFKIEVSKMKDKFDLAIYLDALINYYMANINKYNMTLYIFIQKINYTRFKLEYIKDTSTLEKLDTLSNMISTRIKDLENQMQELDNQIDSVSNNIKKSKEVKIFMNKFAKLHTDVRSEFEKTSIEKNTTVFGNLEPVKMDISTKLKFKKMLIDHAINFLDSICPRYLQKFNFEVTNKGKPKHTIAKIITKHKIDVEKSLFFIDWYNNILRHKADQFLSSIKYKDPILTRIIDFIKPIHKTFDDFTYFTELIDKISNEYLEDHKLYNKHEIKKQFFYYFDFMEKILFYYVNISLIELIVVGISILITDKPINDENSVHELFSAFQDEIDTILKEKAIKEFWDINNLLSMILSHPKDLTDLPKFAPNFVKPYQELATTIFEKLLSKAQ